MRLLQVLIDPTDGLPSRAVVAYKALRVLPVRSGINIDGHGHFRIVRAKRARSSDHPNVRSDEAAFELTIELD